MGTINRKIEANNAKYIKLGPKGSFEKICIENSDIRLGYYDVPHEMAKEGNRKAIINLYLDQGKTSSVAKGHARQVLDFYQTKGDTIWITFIDGFLWWCQTSEKVEYLGSNREENPNGSRKKKILYGWSNKSQTGEELLINSLSGHLTKVAAYRQTICDIKELPFDYLIRKLNNEELPEIIVANSARTSLQQATEKLLKLLTWQDFELFIDLLFSQSGWRKVSKIGGVQKTIDLELIHPLTNERAIVQVKSKTNQNQLEDYIDRLSAYSTDKVYYAYHSSDNFLETKESEIILLGCSQLADSAIKVGMVDWLIEKVG